MCGENVTLTPSPIRKTAVIAANSAWNIANFRAPLISALRDAGWDVIALAPDDGRGAAIEALGARFVPIAIDNSGTSIFRDARLLGDYMRILRELRPHAFLGFTAKPNIYGSLAARLVGVEVINNISGLGTAFIRPGLLNWFVSHLYRWSLRGSARVFFQNNHDRDLFLRRRLVREEQAKVIPGSGIDLDRFRPIAKRADAPFRFLFVGRLLRDKGLVEYADAARLLRPNWPDVEFAILGFGDSDNRTAVPLADVRRWEDEKLVTYFGDTDDVRPFIADCDCVVLPSYREGLPRSLLEAAAMSRPMIATDVPGCNGVVAHGENGFLCDVRSARSLAASMDAMLRLTETERDRMGRKARSIVEQRFGQKIVTDAYLEALQ